jgi:hypothetical protein
MAHAIAINFTPPNAAPRHQSAAPTHPTGNVKSRIAIAAGRTASDNAMVAIPHTASARTRLVHSSSASGWSRAGWRSESSAMVGLIAVPPTEPSLHPSRLCYRYCPMMLIENGMN